MFMHSVCLVYSWSALNVRTTWPILTRSIWIVHRRIFAERSRFRCTMVACTLENVIGMVISWTVFSKAENVIGGAADIERMRYIEEIPIGSGQRTSIDVSWMLH